MPTVRTVLQKLKGYAPKVLTDTDKEYISVSRSSITEARVVRSSITILKSSELTSGTGPAGGCVFLIKDHEYDLDTIARDDVAVVEFEGHISAEGLVEDVSAIIDKAAAHARNRMRLVDVLLSRGSLGELFSEAAAIFGNPIFLGDVSSRILTSAMPEGRKADMDYAITNSLGQGYTPYEDLRTWKFSSLMERVMRSNSPVVLNYPSTASPRRMFCRVKKGYLYAVITEVVREYDAFDEDLLVFFTKLVNSVLEKAPASKAPWANFFVELIDGSISDNKACEDRTAACNLHLKKYKYLAMIKMHSVRSETGESDQMSLANIRAHIENLWSEYRAFYYRGETLVLIDSNAERAIPEFTEAMSSLLAATDCSASISSRFQDLLDLKLSYQQAKLAMTTGTELGLTGPVATFDDLYFYCIAESVRKSHPLELFCAPGIIKLMEHDTASDSNLLDTLGVYLECGRNVRRVSRVLCLHRNTVTYRLKKISELIDEDLDSVTDCYKLFLSLRMTDLIRGRA